MRVSAQHVHDEKVHLPVAINVGDIDAHRAGAHSAHRQLWQRLEPPPAVVDPNPVGRPEIIADVKVGKPVAIQVAKRGSQPPIERRLGQRPALFIAEAASDPGHRSEVSCAIV